MPELQISAIVCTHNREEYLGAAIDSLLHQDFYNYEVIVVDNASSDRTRQLVEERLANPRLNYVYEESIGSSFARNAGANEARAPILAYLDDDAIASPQWLKTLYNAYQSHEQLAIAGGKVTLLWPDGVESPPWLSSELAAHLGAYNLGDSIVYITYPGLTPRGLNYSIRKSFLEEVGGFNVKLGRVGRNLLSNEELHMTELALWKGYLVAYLPEAVVSHNISPERLKRHWFLQQSWWKGISEYQREQLTGRAGWGQLSGGSRQLINRLYQSAKHFRNPALRFDNLVDAYGQLGYLSAAFQGMLRKFNP
jgi:glycosyltransferase involved in cell wall biosynthesis